MKRSELQSNLAMTVTLISGAMMFITLFMGYAIYRTSADVWPPMGVAKVSLWLPFLSTLLIAISSWYAYQVRLKVSASNFKSAHANLHLTIMLGFGFMLAQSALWYHLKSTGIFVTSGIYASVMYAFTWIHAFHVVLGLLGLIYLRFVIHAPSARALQVTINVEKFWHFLGIIWVTMFLGLFVF